MHEGGTENTKTCVYMDFGCTEEETNWQESDGGEMSSRRVSLSVTLPPRFPSSPRDLCVHI